MNDLTPDTAWAPAPKPSRWRTVRRGLWNTMAIFGIAGVLATLFGLVQGYRMFSGLPEATDPQTSVSTEQSNTSFDLTLPDEYVGADLQPIPPLDPFPLAGAAVSLRNPFERILVWPNLFTPTGRDVMRDSQAWAVEESGLGYECGLTVPDLSFPESVEVSRCVRPLKAYEARTAQSDQGNLLYLLFRQGTSSFLIQLTLTGDLEEVEQKAERVLSTLTYEERPDA